MNVPRAFFCAECGRLPAADSVMPGRKRLDSRLFLACVTLVRGQSGLIAISQKRPIYIGFNGASQVHKRLSIQQELTGLLWLHQVIPRHSIVAISQWRPVAYLLATVTRSIPLLDRNCFGNDKN